MRNAALLGMLISLVVLVAYASSVNAAFLTFDDPLYVTQNLRIQTGGWAGFIALWSPHDALHGAFIEYFPLRDSVYWVTCQLFGLDPLPFHITKMLLHGLVSFFVAVFARQLGVGERSAGIAALLFAAHPGHIESVVWIAGLKDPMYVLFLLLSIIFYIRARTHGALSFLLSLIFLVFSLLSKSMGFVAPALLLLVDLHDRSNERHAVRTAVLRVLPSVAVCVAFLALFVLVARANGVIVPPHGGSWRDHTVLALWAFARYLQQAIVPVDFQFLRCVADPEGILNVRFFVGLGAVLGYVFALWRLRRHRLPFLLLAWFPIALFPVLNVIPFPALIADRYLYAPSIAVVIGFALALEQVPPRLRNGLAIACVSLLVLVTAARGALWNDELLLWLDMADDEACVDTGLPDLNIGNVLVRRDSRKALESYHRGMNRPGYAELDILTRCAAHAAAAKAALEISELALAQRHIARATTLCPEDPFAWQTASDIAVAAGDVAAELKAAETAALLSGNARTQNHGRGDGRPIAGLLWNRGLARFRAGLVAGAAEDFAAVLAADPAGFCPRWLAWKAETPAAEAGEAGAVVGCAPSP